MNDCEVNGLNERIDHRVLEVGGTLEHKTVNVGARKGLRM